MFIIGVYYCLLAKQSVFPFMFARLLTFWGDERSQVWKRFLLHLTLTLTVAIISEFIKSAIPWMTTNSYLKWSWLGTLEWERRVSYVVSPR